MGHATPEITLGDMRSGSGPRQNADASCGALTGPEWRPVLDGALKFPKLYFEGVERHCGVLDIDLSVLDADLDPLERSRTEP